MDRPRYLLDELLDECSNDIRSGFDAKRERAPLDKGIGD
jgi:hypothetical protein